MIITRSLLSAMEKSTGYPSRAYVVVEAEPFGGSQVLCMEVEAFGKILKVRHAIPQVPINIPAPLFAGEVIKKVNCELQREAFAQEAAS